MAKKKFFLFRWFTSEGWIGKMFEHTEAGTISVEAACTKGAQFLGVLLDKWTIYEPLFDVVVSDDGAESADKVEDVVRSVKTMLEETKTLPDAADKMKDFKFAENPEWNTFYHTLLSKIAIASEDGKYSGLELTEIGIYITAFVKEHD